jgi:hypothetical protein
MNKRKRKKNYTMRHYLYESQTSQLDPFPCQILARSPWQDLEQRRAPGLTAPTGEGHTGVGWGAGKHRGTHAHSWGCTAWLEPGPGSLATCFGGLQPCGMAAVDTDASGAPAASSSGNGRAALGLCAAEEALGSVLGGWWLSDHRLLWSEPARPWQLHWQQHASAAEAWRGIGSR